MAKDAIVLLKEDHKAMRKLFRQFQKAGEDAKETKDRVARADHGGAHRPHVPREQVHVPRRSASCCPRSRTTCSESYEEHHVADLLVFELFTMSANGQAVRAEDDGADRERRSTTWGRRRPSGSPRSGPGLGRKKLGELGDRMVELKKSAPRSPMAPKAMKKAFDAAHA